MTVSIRNRIMTYATFGVCLAVYMVGLEVAQTQELRLLSALPLIVLMGLTLFFRKPKFMEDHFKEAVEKDAKRGLFSIKNLGMLIILLVSAAFYFASNA